MFGILGINKRNINYITKLNPSKSIRLADNKYQTKQFLSARGIPVPETLDMIRTRHKLWSYDFSTLNKDFVIKPNKWSRWRGIMVTSITWADQIVRPPRYKYMHHIADMFGLDTIWSSELSHYGLKCHGHVFDPNTYKKMCIQILDGTHSLGDQKDTILIEEKLIPWSGFEKFCEYGLADLRIICYKLIPVIAMLRMPTALSQGKANLHAGGLGLGINMATGKIISLMQGRQVYQHSFPEEFAYLYHKRIPFRDDVLLYSSRIQFFVNLGYMALDRVITKNGPKLLELNARAGMEIQNITLAWLEDRLQKVRWLKVYTPEQGLTLSRNLFGNLKHDDHNKKIINLSQKWHIVDLQEIHKPLVVRVKCDLNKAKNYMSPKVAQILKKWNRSDYQLFLPDSEITFKYPNFHVTKYLNSNQVILGKDSLADFLIKPIDNFDPKISFINPQYIIEDEVALLHNIDQKLTSIKTYTNLTNILRPINYLEEFDTFVTRKWNYNPQFIYKFPKIKELQNANDILHKLQEKYFGNKRMIQSKFAILLEQKIQEQLDKIALIKAYKNQDLDNIKYYNQLLYGDFDPHLIAESYEQIQSYKPLKRAELGDLLTKAEVRSEILQHLHRRNIMWVRVRLVDTMVSRLSISIGATIKINILSTADIRRDELQALLAHEIDTHLLRYLNGAKKWRNIFRTGTSKYLRDEEGLAIYNAIQAGGSNIAVTSDIKSIYYKYYLCHLAQSMNFVGLVWYINQIKEKSLSKSAFKTAMRFKRGIMDTSKVHSWALFSKDKLYLEWYQKISQWVSKGGDISKLMIGKIKIEDIDYIA